MKDVPNRMTKLRLMHTRGNEKPSAFALGENELEEFMQYLVAHYYRRFEPTRTDLEGHLLYEGIPVREMSHDGIAVMFDEPREAPMDDERMYQLTCKGQIYAVIKQHCPTATTEEIKALIGDRNFWSAIVGFALEVGVILPSEISPKFIRPVS